MFVRLLCFSCVLCVFISLIVAGGFVHGVVVVVVVVLVVHRVVIMVIVVLHLSSLH